MSPNENQNCLDKSLLDVQVIVRGGKLITDLYVKQTDSHQYLDPSLRHPYHCSKSISYSQTLRINRICLENVLTPNKENRKVFIDKPPMTSWRKHNHLTLSLR